MSRPIRVLVYGNCPELDFCELDLEISRFEGGEVRDSVIQELRGFDLAILEARGDDEGPLNHVRYLRKVAPSCSTIMVAEPEAIDIVHRAIDNGLHDFVMRCATPEAMGRLLTHTIELTMRHVYIKGRFHESEKRFWTFFDNCPIGLVIMGLSGKCEHANPAFQDLVGYSLHDLREMSADKLLVDEDSAIWKSLRKELKNGKRDFVKMEQQFIHESGEPRWTRFACLAMRDPDGSPAYYLGMVMDRTGRKRIQENLQHADKMHAMGRLAGGVAHDFNNILTIINSHCFIMKDSMHQPDRLVWSLERIMTATNRGSKLTRQLLTFGRRHARETEVVDPNELLEDMQVVLESLFGRVVRVEMALGEDLRGITADRSQIEQVVMNLALNARDAMPDGGQFTVRTYNLDVEGPSSAVPAELPRGLYSVLEISDTGAGMSTEIQQKVFEPFFTTKGVGEGTGLGLSTVYGVVTQDDGHIVVDSEEGRGTTFYVYFPSTRQDSATPPKLRRARKGTPTNGTETILLVEDEAELREPLRQLLEEKGYEVMEAANAEEALTISREYDGPIELLLTDVIMPGANGVSLAEMITSDREETVVLLMSGYTADILSMGSEGGEQHKLLQKPFGMDILSRTIRQMLKAP